MQRFRFESEGGFSHGVLNALAAPSCVPDRDKSMQAPS
jgi:hypothetical protein